MVIVERENIAQNFMVFITDSTFWKDNQIFNPLIISSCFKQIIISLQKRDEEK